MGYCRLKLVDDQWYCPACDRSFRATNPARPPRRNCTATPGHQRTPLDPATILDRVRYDLGTGIDDDDWPEVKRRALVCLGCEKFSGYGCAELGKRCRTGRIRWLERLVMRDCQKWC